MTPSQLDHLRRIDARLAKLLETAKHRTPGVWRHNEGRRMQLSALTMHQDPVLHGDEYVLSGPDGDFIASCAGNAEAGWESTRKIIHEALYLRSDAPGELGSILQIILAQWPLELLATAEV